MAEYLSIREFYAGRSMFITGATGFLGKVLVEKVLRTCPEIDTIYLLVRAKKDVDPLKRLHSLLDCKLFELLSRQQPNFRDKVKPIVGDITEDKLGISDEDRELLIRKVSIIFHFAATIRFDDPIKVSTQINMVGVMRMLELARQLNQLDAFVHVSTAYANCDQKIIEERVYPTTPHPHKLIDDMECMSDDMAETLSPKLVASRPNTYTYTKAMAERILEEEADDLPVAIVRPSIVGPTWKDPFPGWVDNFAGPTSFCAAIGTGTLHKMMGNDDCAADIIPCDIAISFFIAVAWETALLKPKDIRVYNCTTEGQNTLYWGLMAKSFQEYYHKIPLNGICRLPKFQFTSSRLYRNISVYLDHNLPAWLMDVYTRMTGGKPKFMRLQQRLWKAVETVEYFTSREWHWTNDNMIALQETLSSHDQKVFDFDVRSIDWNVYLDNWCLGTKCYALKESMDDLPKAKSKIDRIRRRDQLKNIAIGVLVCAFLTTLPIF